MMAQTLHYLFHYVFTANFLLLIVVEVTYTKFGVSLLKHGFFWIVSYICYKSVPLLLCAFLYDLLTNI